MAADAASATVNIARRINGSRNISRGISESSSPHISRNNSSIGRGINESSNISSGTSNISNRSATAVPEVSSATSAAAARTAFRGMGSITRLFQVWQTRAFYVGVPCSTPHAQAKNYSYSEDCVNFGSGPPPSQSAPAPPGLHASPVPSDSSWSSFSEQATLAQFAPPSKSHVPNESVVGGVTLPGSYLHSAFVVQSGSNEDDVWIADTGASCHMTHDRTKMYNARPPPPGRETITIGDRRRIKVKYIYRQCGCHFPREERSENHID